MTTNDVKKNILLDTLKEGSNSFSIIGYVVFWNVRNVNLDRTKFATYLEECGIDKKFAKPHNYRSALIRALRSMEQDRIIRRVNEDHNFLTFQFTTESMVEGNDGKELSYKKETLVEVDKNQYHSTGSFPESITKCDDKIKGQLIELFNAHKDKYDSSDITRYLHLIFKDQADIISLRPQGSIYFIPAAFKNVIDAISHLVEMIGPNCKLDYIPIPNVEMAKQAIRTSLVEEINGDMKAIEEDVEAVLSGDKEVSGKWTQTRIDRIKKMLNRIEAYNNGGIVLDIKGYQTSMEEIEKKILGVRRLDLEEVP